MDVSKKISEPTKHSHSHFKKAFFAKGLRDPTYHFAKNEFSCIFLPYVHFEASRDPFKHIIWKPGSYWFKNTQREHQWMCQKNFQSRQNTHIVILKKLFLPKVWETPRIIFQKMYFLSFSCPMCTLKRRVILSSISSESLGLTDSKTHNENMNGCDKRIFRADKTPT